MWKTLTPREKEVVQWLREGKSNTMIARIMGISPRTVEKHCEHIYEKLGVNCRIGVFWHLIESGLDLGGALLLALAQLALGALASLG